MKKTRDSARRLGIALLAFLMIMTAVLGTGCKKDEETTNTTDTEVIVPEGHFAADLSDYKIIRPETISNSCLAKAEQLGAALEEKSGTAMTISDDWLAKGTTPDDEAYEILIGGTNRPQSAESLAKVTDFGYIIEKNGNKIVINGTNEILVEAAIDRALELLSVQGTSLVLPEQTLEGSLEYLRLGTDKKPDFALIVPASEQTYFASLITSFNKEVEKVMGEQVAVYAKAEENTDTTYSVMFSFENTKGGDANLGTCNASEYSIYSSGKKIYLNGSTTTALSAGVSAFGDLLETCMVEDGGEKVVKLYKEYAVKASNVGTDFTIPEYTDGKVDTIVENNPGYFYYIEETSAEAFDAYLKRLEEAGFVLYSSNAAQGNKFATYTNEHIMLHTYYTAYSKTVRIITEQKGDMLSTTPTEPTENYTTQSVTQVVLGYTSSLSNNMGGMSYIITLADSTFIVIDGGTSTSNNLTNTDKLYSELQRLNKRPDGKIIINAWYITHPHTDHYLTYEHFAEKYGSEVTLESVICNMPSSYYNGISTTGAPDAGNAKTWNHDGSAVNAAAKKFGKNVKVYTPHTGQIFYVKNIKFEVLYTYEDLYPNRFEDTFNDTGLVMRMTIGGKTILWAADIYTAETHITHSPSTVKVCACDVMVKMWDTYLKSDIVQMPHHGYATSGGPTWYKKVGAKIGLWSQGKHWIDTNENYQSKYVRQWFYAGGGTTIYYEYEECTLTF